MALGLFGKKAGTSSPEWRIRFDVAGVSIHQGDSGQALDPVVLPGYLAQLVDDGLATETEEGVDIDWDGIYAAMSSSDYDQLDEVLCLPPFSDAVPSLRSHGSLTDPDFSIVIDGWGAPGTRQGNATLKGALLLKGDGKTLLKIEQWELIKAVLCFAQRTQAQREGSFQRAAWGHIRQLALKANARLDDFLDRSVVLTPDRLQLELRRSNATGSDRVIEVIPQFEGAPFDWLDRFDARSDVPELYNIPTERGMLQVLVTPQVRTVLQEIKRMPARRVAGSRAEAFILNPYASLGADAAAVIDEKQLEEARSEAGLQYERFSPQIEFNAFGNPDKVGLLVETATVKDRITSRIEWLDDQTLREFVGSLDHAISQGHQLLGWNGYDFEIQGDSSKHLEKLKSVLELRANPPPLISWDQVHDLSAYSARIEGIGEEKPYYSPYIAKKKDQGGWVPDNVEPFVVYTPKQGVESILIPINGRFIEDIRKKLQFAKENGQDEIHMPGLPQAIPLGEANNIVDAFGNVRQKIDAGEFDPPKESATRSLGTGKRPRTTLILRPNINQVDFEVRRQVLQDIPVQPWFPAGLREDALLLPHQMQGLAWLQHLYRAQDELQVEGCVLADDMGLGKTFQLLAFMVWCLEQDPNTSPMLVVAPVSLLENWQDEVSKFLRPGVLPILIAYGDALSELRVGRHEIDERLRKDEGLINFLKPGWAGNAKLVLTTYETLRDLEFSFAAQHWSVMVCDEAQRIKNPAAMVTRAAKKQKVDFRIACTGTPVENTLADLWCLFDFVQPGLLGALDEFGKLYRKPIEARNDEDRARTEELREKIAPQLLRRTKAEVAKDLPAKLVDENCRHLSMSVFQQSLYSHAVEEYKRKAGKPGAMLELLHYLRLICSDPRPRGMTAGIEPLKQYRTKSPKMHWLLSQLDSIREEGEKAIVFCEFRDIQRILQHYIQEMFNYKADIINGDTTAATGRADNRQQRIKRFQSASGFGVIILSPVAVGFGVNIQAANHVIHFTRTWNPAKEDQATDRAYRIGQTKAVHVYYPVIQANGYTTFDVKLDQLLSQKRALASDMLNGSGDLKTGEFDVGDIAPKGQSKGINPRITIDETDTMLGRAFEGLIAALWAKLGNDLVFCTPASGDHGVDVVAINGSTGLLIQTKVSSREGAKLGWEAVKDVVGGSAYYQQRYKHIDFIRVGVTNQYFNANTRQQAEVNEVSLIERPKLQEMLDRYLITYADMQTQLTDYLSIRPDFPS